MSSPLSWLFLVLSTCLNAGASLLLKLSTSSGGSAGLLAAGGSVGCYGLAYGCYYMCLRKVPVSTAYPLVTGGAVLIIVLLATHFLGERLTSAKSIGALLVILGGILLMKGT